jgi:hypothetical protein
MYHKISLPLTTTVNVKNIVNDQLEIISYKVIISIDPMGLKYRDYIVSATDLGNMFN